MPTAPISYSIVEYDPRWCADFARLNIEWPQRWFEVDTHYVRADVYRM